jgi:hypothetical protein
MSVTSASAAPPPSGRGEKRRERADHPAPPSVAAMRGEQKRAVRNDGIGHLSSFRLAPGSLRVQAGSSNDAHKEFGLTLVAHGEIAAVETRMNFS